MTEKEIKKIVKVTVEEVHKHKLKPAKNPFQLTELYLSQYKNMEESIQIKLDTIKELREDIPGPKSPTLVQDVVRGGKVENKSQLERREEVINHLVIEVEELSALKLQIEKVMDKYKCTLADDAAYEVAVKDEKCFTELFVKGEAEIWA